MPLYATEATRGPGFHSGIAANYDLYSYTSGRFLFDESLRLHERYVEFDHIALLRETEKFVGRDHGRATHIAKLAEGGFNHVFLIKMDDGLEVVAKIPYRFTGPKYYATASDAATLCFLHSKSIPMPRLYGYSPSEDNPVGVEYILMEKAKGVGLQNKWHGMSKRDRHKLALSFVEIEKKFFSIPFWIYGEPLLQNGHYAGPSGCTICSRCTTQRRLSSILYWSNSGLHVFVW